MKFKRTKAKPSKIEYERIGSGGRQESWILLAAQILFFGACCSLLLAMCGEAPLIPWIIPGAAAFAGIAVYTERWKKPYEAARGSFDDIDTAGRGTNAGQQRRQKLRFVLIIIGILLLAGILLRNDILNGMALILNHLYALGESAQAYLYDRFEITLAAEAQQSRAMRIAVVWTAVAAGCLTALPPAGIRLWICAGLAVLICGIFAFIGLIPMALPMGLFLLAGGIIAAGGRLRSALPLLVVLAVVFALVLALDPGESKQVSRADEQLRDYLAVSTVRLEGMKTRPQEENAENDQEEEKDQGGASEEDGQNFLQHRKGYIIGLMALIALILFIPAIIHDRLEKRRRKNRAGIDSPDPAAAIRAMFPYAVRWLRAGGMSMGNVTYVSLQPGVRRRFSAIYADEYDRMLCLWREAAYSNHPMDETRRQEMTAFMNRTIRMINERCSLRDKLRIRFLQAL